MGMAIKGLMAKRAAEEIEHGNVVNLGFGLPQQVVNYLPSEKIIFFQTENGVIGLGPMAKKGEEDPDVVDAGCIPVTTIPGACFCDGADSFGLIRSGNVDIAILGVLQVAENGDLANWMSNGASVPGMGGAMDLAQKAKKVIAITAHQTKTGEAKLKKLCDYPLTAKNCVSLVITDLGVLEVTDEGFLLKELFLDHTVEEVIEKTDADVKVSETIRIIGEDYLMVEQER